MATVALTPDHDTIEAEIFVAAPPERVFQALTDPSQMPRWWGQAGMYRITECQADLRPGGKWSSVGVGADGTSFRVDGEYLEVDPPRLLVHTWAASFNQLARTVVRWELEPRPVHNLQTRGPEKREWEPRSNCAIPDSPAMRRPLRITARVRSACSPGCRPSWKTARPSTRARRCLKPANLMRDPERYFTPFSGSHDPCSLRTKTISPM